MTNHPRHPDQLPGTKWTSREGLLEFRHWEVDVVRSRRGTVVLRATLDGARTIELPWRDLRNRADWTPGWTSTD